MIHQVQMGIRFLQENQKGAWKSAQEYPFGKGGWGVKNYLGDALMPGS